MKSKNNIKTHQRYFVNDKRVPGTTTILGVLNKPALIHWAWDLGTQGIDYRKYTDEMAKIGTLIHERIEAHIKGSEVNFDDYTKTQISLSDVGFSKFLDWEKENKPIYIESELQLASDKYLYGGTIDLYAKINDKFVLIDFKSSNNIYDDHFCQVSAYAQLLRENDLQVDDIMILRVGRDETEGFEVRSVINEKLYFEVFKSCLIIYEAKKKLKWR